MATRLLCTPARFEKLEQDSKQLDKFHGPALLRGDWRHPYLPYGIDVTEKMMRDWAAKWNEHRQHLEIPTPDGHTDDADKNRGYLDRDYEWKVVEYDFNGEKVLGLDVGYEIKDPETIRAANAGTLGRSVSICDDFRYSTGDGEVHELGQFPKHICFTPEPVISMPALEPTIALSKTGEQLEYVPLFDSKHFASRMVTWQDLPPEVANGSRKANQKESGYNIGTPEANCSRCLSRTYAATSPSDPMSPMQIGCEWVDDPIKESGYCKFFRPRYYSYSVKHQGGEIIFSTDLIKSAEQFDKSRCGKLEGRLDSALTTLYEKMLGTEAPEKLEGVAEMDLKQLAKKIGVAETEDVEAFAKSVAELSKKNLDAAVAAGITTGVADQVRAFAKDLGVDVTDLSKAGEAIKAHFAAQAEPKADTEVAKQFAKLTEDFAKQQEQVKQLAKENADMKLESAVTGRQAKLQARIGLSKAEGKANKADEENVLTIGKDGDKAITISLQFSKEAKYDAAWDRDMYRAEILMDEIEKRPKNSAVPAEKTKTSLSRFQSDPTISDDDKPPTEEELDKLWGKKRKQSAA